MSQPPVQEQWALVTVAGRNSDEVVVGIWLPESDTVRAPDFLRTCRSVADVFNRWEELEPLLRGHDPATGEAIEVGQWLTPMRYPRKVLCSGPNYTDHLAEMGESSLGDEWTGYFFFKPPTTTLVGPHDPIVVGDHISQRVDWEGELAVVIGRGGRDIAPSQALAHVAGYTVANDVSFRGPHRRNTPAAPFVWDWTASKAADTSLPLGPGVVPAWLVPDVRNLRIRTWVNRELKQDGNTANMVLDVPHLIADASSLVTLEPGDVILTGTPAGVGASSGTFLHPGDVVEVEITGIGRIINRVQQRQERSNTNGTDHASA